MEDILKGRNIYRGKDAETGQWVYGQLIVEIDTYYIINEDDEYLIDPNTLGQYTTVNDIKDNRIFEGDIVECVSWNEFFCFTTETGTVKNPFRRKLSVIWKDGAFKLMEQFKDTFMRPSVWDMCIKDNTGDLTIIGNIHDNPGLEINGYIFDNND
jgi:uncharacterized phage protein (TIGR01671 family)